LQETDETDRTYETYESHNFVNESSAQLFVVGPAGTILLWRENVLEHHAAHC
jgi:hypothetical protein